MSTIIVDCRTVVCLLGVLQSAVDQVIGRLLDWNLVTHVHQAAIRTSPEQRRAYRVRPTDHTLCRTPLPPVLTTASVSS